MKNHNYDVLSKVFFLLNTASTYFESCAKLFLGGKATFVIRDDNERSLFK